MPKDESPDSEARRLAEEGNYEAALEKHIWIHNHILDQQPSYYGVRLSFALGAWVDLGEKYPKALEVLKQIRDQKTDRLLNGEYNREIFHDVFAINRTLAQPASTISLFKRLESSSPDFAENIYSLCDESLVDAKEFTLARKYMGDPMARLQTAEQNFTEGMSHAATLKRDAASRRAYESIFTSQVVGIITVLKNTDERPLAEQVQITALKLLDNSTIRRALKTL